LYENKNENPKTKKNSCSETLRQKPTGKEAKQTLGTKHTHTQTIELTDL
jgi:hypothetical protein